MRVKDLLNKNSLYQSIYRQMMNYESAYLGGLAFKQATRRKRPSEDSTLYIDLIGNTVAQPICRYIVDTINDVLFEPGIKRNIMFCTEAGAKISPEATEWSDLFLKDADCRNRSLNGFMEQVGDLTSIFGHCWVAVDMPQQKDGNLGRPYVASISPLDVWDWDFEYYGGRPMVSYVKIKESEDNDCYTIKCYYLGDASTPSYWQAYEIEKNESGSKLEEDAKLTGEGYFPPGMCLPLFIAYGRKDPRIMDLGVSDIDSASDAMREYYKLECEKYSSLQMAHTLIRADKGIAIPVHAGAIVRATTGQVEAIKVDTGDVTSILAAQQDILEQIEALTGLGGLRNSKNSVQSGVAIVAERKQLHRVAKSKARLMEITEGMIWTFVSRFMGIRWAGQINYNTDYEAHDTAYRMALMNSAKTLAPLNPMVDAMIVKEMISMLAPDESAQEYQDAFIATIQDPAIRILMTEEENEVSSGDIGTEIPIGSDAKENIEEGTESGGDNASLLGGAGTPVINTGMSLYPAQAVAVQLAGINVGR